MFIQPPAFNSWYKDIVELGQFINLDISDDVFSSLLSVLLLKTKTNYTVSAGFALDATALNDLKIKRKVIRRISSILDNLTRIKQQEHDDIKREIVIAVDNAQSSLMVIFEFSEFTTTVTINSKPLEGMSQSTYHVKNQVNKTFILTSVSSLFTYVEQKVSNNVSFNNFEEPNIVVKLNFKSFQCTNTVNKFMNSVPGIKKVYFYLGDDTPIILKTAYVEYLLSILQTFINESDIQDNYNHLVLEMNTLKAMMKPYPTLECI